MARLQVESKEPGMVSQLLKNDKISFVACRNFSSRGKDYAVGDDFPQEDARDIEVFVRARYVIPVVDDIADKTHIRHWHTEIRPKDEVLERLARDRVQLQMPDPPDSDEVVNLEVLTHPETTPEPTQADDNESGAGEGTSEPEDEPAPEYDPADHTVNEVLAYLSEHPEDRERVLQSEAAGRGRKGILEE
jgi:hypothetical protein